MNLMRMEDPIFAPLIADVRQTVGIPDSRMETFLNPFEPVHLVRRQLYLETGEHSNHMRFVARGCLRAFYTDKKGDEYTIQFGIKGWWINDLYSYLSHKPATLNIQAVLPSTVLQIHREQLELLFDRIPAVERFFRLKIQRAYVALQERTVGNMSQSLEERYLNFINTYREIEQNVPQYMVASYLGATPEHLSKVRKELYLK